MPLYKKSKEYSFIPKRILTCRSQSQLSPKDHLTPARPTPPTTLTHYPPPCLPPPQPLLPSPSTPFMINHWLFIPFRRKYFSNFHLLIISSLLKNHKCQEFARFGFLMTNPLTTQLAFVLKLKVLCNSVNEKIIIQLIY